MSLGHDQMLEALTSKAMAGQWSIEQAIDWRQAIRPPVWLPHKWYVFGISQFVYGEELARETCARLAALLPNPAVTAFVATQSADEARHAGAYRRYLERLGDIATIDPGLARAKAGMAAWQGSPLGLMIACHIVLEGEAIGLHNTLSNWFPCPLLASINELVSRDEARHVVFGKRFLRVAVRSLAADERAHIHAWVRGLYLAVAELDERDSPSGSPSLRRALFAKRWRRHRRSLANIGLIDVEPNRGQP